MLQRRPTKQGKKPQTKRNLVMNKLSAALSHLAESIPRVLSLGEALETGRGIQDVNKSQLTQRQPVKLGLPLATRAARGQCLSPTCASSTISARCAVKTSRSRQEKGAMAPAWCRLHCWLILVPLGSAGTPAAASRRDTRTRARTSAYGRALRDVHQPVLWGNSRKLGQK